MKDFIPLLTFPIYIGRRTVLNGYFTVLLSVENRSLNVYYSQSTIQTFRVSLWRPVSVDHGLPGSILNSKYCIVV